MLVVYLLIISFGLLIYWLQPKSKYKAMVNRFPGPTSLPIMGNIMEWSNKPDIFFKQMRKYSTKYKNTYRLWAGTVASVNIITPADVEIILSSQKHIKKSSLYYFLYPWLGSGLLTSAGYKWQKRRKILTPAFHFSILRRFVEIFKEHSEKIVLELKEECNKNKTDVVPFITKCTLNIICETAMGTNLNSNGTEERKYVNAIYKYVQILIYRALRPWYYNDFIFRNTPVGRRGKKYINILHNFSRRVIKEREKNFNSELLKNLENDEECFKSRKRLAMLDLLIDSKRNKADIDDEGIRQEVDTFMFEGHDTTAMALCFALMLLANHKNVQDKITAELNTIFGDSQRAAEYQDLHNMKYLEICLKECLRLYPSVPLISRGLKEDLKLSSGCVPAGTMVNIHIFDLHRNPNTFPDPEKFDPDRFLPANCVGRHPYSYVPFSAGPRNCIGQKFAMLEMKSIVSSILRNYVLEPVDRPEDLVLTTDIVLRNKSSVFVKFKQRYENNNTIC